MQPTLAKSIAAQLADEVCQNAAGHIGYHGSELMLNDDKVLVRRASIVEALQKLVP